MNYLAVIAAITLVNSKNVQQLLNHLLDSSLQSVLPLIDPLCRTDNSPVSSAITQCNPYGNNDCK